MKQIAEEYSCVTCGDVKLASNSTQFSQLCRDDAEIQAAIVSVTLLSQDVLSTSDRDSFSLTLNGTTLQVRVRAGSTQAKPNTSRETKPVIVISVTVSVGLAVVVIAALLFTVLLRHRW